MGKEFHLRLDSLDVGQILDGLRCRQESWANTAIYLRDQPSSATARQADYFPDEAFLCEECSDPDEAQRLVDWYQRIIANIERQLDEQGGF
jgi:hypothetical protein